MRVRRTIKLNVPESLRIESRTVRYTLYTLSCVVIADGLLTQFLVTSGYGEETNPFMTAWIGHGGFWLQRHWVGCIGQVLQGRLERPHRQTPTI